MTLDVESTAEPVGTMRESIIEARSIIQRISPMLAEYEITVDDWLIMDSLAEDPGQTMAQLAARTRLPASSLTRFVDRLVCSAMMYRRPNLLDRRQIFVYLSERGFQIIDNVNAMLEADALLSQEDSSIPTQ